MTLLPVVAELVEWVLFIVDEVDSPGRSSSVISSDRDVTPALCPEVVAASPKAVDWVFFMADVGQTSVTFSSESFGVTKLSSIVSVTVGVDISGWMPSVPEFSGSRVVTTEASSGTSVSRVLPSRSKTLGNPVVVCSPSEREVLVAEGALVLPSASCFGVCAVLEKVFEFSSSPFTVPEVIVVSEVPDVGDAVVVAAEVRRSLIVTVLVTREDSVVSVVRAVVPSTAALLIETIDELLLEGAVTAEVAPMSPSVLYGSEDGSL